MTGLSADINQLRGENPPLSCAALAAGEDNVEHTDVIGMRMIGAVYQVFPNDLQQRGPTQQRVHLIQRAVWQASVIVWGRGGVVSSCDCVCRQIKPCWE